MIRVFGQSQIHRLRPAGPVGISQPAAEWQTRASLADLLAGYSHLPGGQVLSGAMWGQHHPADCVGIIGGYKGIVCTPTIPAGLTNHI